MNNKRNIYRVHHQDNILLGPYLYAIKNKTNDPELLNKLLSNEDVWHKIRPGYKLDKINEKLSKIKVFSEEGCFTCYRAKRPGPWDDPDLKANLRSLGINRQKMINEKLCNYFAFDSEEQLFNWFDDIDEMGMLMDRGFVISKIKENSSNIVQGLKQVLILK
jgi:hypothetical protein